MKRFKYEQGQVGHKIFAIMTEKYGNVEHLRKHFKANFHQNAALQKRTDTDHYVVERGQKGFVLQKYNKTMNLQLIYWKLMMNTLEGKNEATNLGVID